MLSPAFSQEARVQRVRAILLTQDGHVLFIKRVKPNNTNPYWVAPGGGVEDDDPTLLDALDRELREELGAYADVIEEGFVLEHHKAGKNLQEFFFVCHLLDYDLSLRHGPEFDDPQRGEYIPDFVPLEARAIAALNILTEELKTWLVDNISYLRVLASKGAA